MIQTRRIFRTLCTKHQNLFVFLFLAVLVAISCYGVFSLHFLNDEWIQLGYIYKFGIFGEFTHNISVLEILSGKGRLFGGLLNNIFFSTFWYNPIPFVVFGITFHLVNSYLVYLVTMEILRKKRMAIITAAVFSVPATAHQALSWLAATVQTVGSMTFVLLSVLIAIRGIKTKNIRFAIASWILAYIALLFKESSFFVFPILLILPYFIDTKVKKRIRWVSMLGVILLLFVIGYTKFIFFWRIPNSESLLPQTFFAFLRSGINFIWYPLVSLGQFFIPSQFMLRLSVVFSHSVYPSFKNLTEGNQIVNFIVTDLVSILASFVVILFQVYIYVKRGYYRKYLLLAAIWYVLTFGPISIFLYNRNNSYIESRYLYYSFFAIAMIVGITIEALISALYSFFKNRSTALVLTIVVFSVFMVKQVSLLRREIRQNIIYGNDITLVMTEVKHVFPKIPAKPIFFVDGDRTFFLTNTHFPLQLGPGYMLMMAYAPSPNVSTDLLGMNYLCGLTDQGYTEVNEKGYGYFFDKDKLLRLFQTDKSLSSDQIVGMYYYGNDRRLIDITQTIREYVDRYR